MPALDAAAAAAQSVAVRWIVFGLATLIVPAAARGEEGRPRVDPKELEIQILRLKDSSPSFRTRAARKIGEWGPAAKSAVPSLAPLLEDAEADVRRAAAFALARMGKDAAEAADRLVEAMKDEDAGVRANAALGLGAAGGGKAGRAALAG